MTDDEPYYDRSKTFTGKKKKKQEIADKYAYDDPFKEDLIHQLWHLVEEVRKVHEKLEKINDSLNGIQYGDSEDEE